MFLGVIYHVLEEVWTINYALYKINALAFS